METNLSRRVHARRISRTTVTVGLTIAVAGLAGCPFAGLPDSTALSDTEPVPVAEGRTVEAALGAGAPSLANSTWAIHKASDDTLVFRIALGPEGQVERLFDSFVLGNPWLGTEIIPDGQPHPTAFEGGSYISGAYAAEEDGRAGILGVIHGLLLGVHVGTATLSFSGAVDGDRIDGPMVRTVTTFADTPFPAPGDAQFDAYALRER